MKIISTFAIILFLFVVPSEASLIVTTTLHDSYWDGFWYPNGRGGAPAGGRIAYEFYLTEPHVVTGYYGTVDVGDVFHDTDETGVYLALYRGSTLSRFFDLPAPKVRHYGEPGSIEFVDYRKLFTVPEGQTEIGESGLDIILPSGKYWAALELTQHRASFSDYRLEGYAVPEPTTMLLLGTGLLGALVRRRKQ